MKELFQSLGASDKEMRIFLKMLELGSQPVSVIARHLKMPRSSVYVILDRLKELQLVETFEHNHLTYAQAIPIRRIEDVLMAKARSVKQAFNLFSRERHTLESLENKLSIRPQVRFFEGKKDVMLMYEEVLKEKSFCAFFNPQLVKDIMPEYYLKIGANLRAIKGKAEELLVNCKAAYEYKKLFNSSLHEIKILPEGVTFPSDTIICERKLYMVSYGQVDVCATEISNPSLAQTQKILFAQLWARI